MTGTDFVLETMRAEWKKQAADIAAKDFPLQESGRLAELTRQIIRLSTGQDIGYMVEQALSERYLKKEGLENCP